jgi:hypothetical protein
MVVISCAMSSRRKVLIALLAYTVLYGIVFARGLINGGPLIHGDSQSEYLPQFAYPLHAWTRLLFSGYPLVADPQNASFSPTRFVFAALGWWNGYAISALVIASTTTFLYTREITKNDRAAFLAGVVFGGSGYMLRNLHLTPMLQTTAWMPLVFWAIERLVKEPRTWVAFIGAAAIALTIFGGFMQPSAYTLVIAGLYAIVGLARAAGHRRRFALLTGFMFIGGLGMAAVQLAPTAELFTRSERTTMPYDQFSGWSWLPVQATELFVPRAFLGRWAPLSGSSTCLVPDHADHTYFSLLALAFGGLGLYATRRAKTTRFWLCVMVFSFVFAFGDATPLAKLVYHVPVYNKFRDPVRHMVFFALGLALLTAHGIASLMQRADAPDAERRRPVVIALASLGGALLLALYVAMRGGCVTFDSAAALTSVVLFGASAAAVMAWIRRPNAAARQATVLALVVFDLATFDGFGYARPTYGGHPLADASYLQLTSSTRAIASALAETKQRLWPIRGQMASRDEIPVNANLMWGVPSAVGYSPIAPVRSLESLGIAYFGAPVRTWWSRDDRSLDVAAVRYVTLPDPSLNAEPMRGIPWHPVDLGLRVDHVTPELVLPLPTGSFDQVALVADLWDSTAIDQDVVVATIDAIEIRAGKDVSEWAIECPEIAPQMKHQRADVIEARPVRSSAGPCPWNRYLVLKEGSFGRELHIRWMGGDRGALRIHRVTAGNIPVVPEVVAIQTDPRWRVRHVTPTTLLAENTRALPRAYVASQVVSVLHPFEVIRSGRLADGSPWDPRQAALREGTAPTVRLDASCASAAVRWLDDTDDAVALEVTSPARCFLVLSDTEYPGWRAAVDGDDVPIERVNGAFRGIFLPEGLHRIRFAFVPRSLLFGAVVSIAVILAFVVFVLAERRRVTAR